MPSPITSLPLDVFETIAETLDFVDLPYLLQTSRVINVSLPSTLLTFTVFIQTDEIVFSAQSYDNRAFKETSP